MNTATTRGRQTLAEFLAERKTCLGGSDYASVLNAGRYGCARKLAYDKLEYPKDFDDSDRMEFRRGHRLEHVAANYYEEKTGREVRVTTRMRVPGKPHLTVLMDRLVIAKERKEPGYLELKVVGRHSFLKLKKEGLIEDYIIQVQGGCAVAGLDWGSYGIYCPELDDLLHWDVEADRELGELILEKGDDFWSFNIECRMLPDPLPEGSAVCTSCPWSYTCREALLQPAASGVVERPDLAGLLEKFAEVKGLGSEAQDAAEGLREEIIQAIKEVPGTYKCGDREFTFTARAQKRFNSDRVKKEMPDFYEACREDQIVKTLKLKGN